MTKKKDKFKDILPSKKFVSIMSLCIGICVIILIFASYFGSSSTFNKAPLSVSKNTTLGELLVQDTNSNGISDWEETLYGLDPKGDGLANKKIIDEKKLKVQKENGITTKDLNDNSETAMLSRQMLSTILALKQSGNLTPEAVSNLADALGQNLDIKRDNLQTYSINDLKVVDDVSQNALLAYAKSFNTILGDANDDGLGKEMAYVYQVLDQNASHDKVKNLDPYVKVYAKFATSIMSLKTPKSISQKSLALANACMLMSHALEKIENMYSDAVSGLIGFNEYTTAASSIQDAMPDLISGFDSPDNSL